MSNTISLVGRMTNYQNVTWDEVGNCQIQTLLRIENQTADLYYLIASSVEAELLHLWGKSNYQIAINGTLLEQVVPNTKTGQSIPIVNVSAVEVLGK